MNNYLNNSINWDAIGAISTLIMSLVALLSLLYNWYLYNKSKTQWEEDNRARIIISIVIIKKLYLLKIQNIGNRPAYNLRVTLNKDFIDKILIEELRERINQLCSKKIHLAPNTSLYYAISPIESSGNVRTYHNTSYTSQQVNENIKYLKHSIIQIKGMYNSIYKIDESFTMDEFTGSIVVKDPIIDKLSDVAEAIKNAQK